MVAGRSTGAVVTLLLLASACGHTHEATSKAPKPAHNAHTHVSPTSIRDDAHGHGVFGPVVEEQLSPADEKRFDEQWRAATRAASGLATPAEATAAGYAAASARAPGVGAHWINWSLLDSPFDPAKPSMLLFDDVPGLGLHLVGHSYWVRSPQEPEGFAGTNDRWHNHRGLCFVGGWLDRQNVPSADMCAGTWIDGSDMWMLHAWVVPEVPNRWGRLAPTNPTLCPSPTRSPDVATCESSLL